MSTSVDAAPSAATTASASPCDAGDDVRYGMSTHRSRSAPIASATRYATRAESMPPDSPRTSRSKPAWRSWPRMNSAMTRRATSVSMDELGRQLERRRGLVGQIARAHRSAALRGPGRRSAPRRWRTRSGEAGARRGRRRGPARRPARRSCRARTRPARRRSAPARGPGAPGARRAAAAARSARAGCRPARCRR